MTGRPELVFDVVGCQTGVTVQGEEPAVVIRLHLRNGDALVCALPADVAAALAGSMALELRRLADRPDPSSH